MRHRFNIRTTDDEEREVIIDAPSRESAEEGLWETYPGAVILGYGRWNPEPEEETVATDATDDSEMAPPEPENSAYHNPPEAS